MALLVLFAIVPLTLVSAMIRAVVQVCTVSVMGRVLWVGRGRRGCCVCVCEHGMLGTVVCEGAVVRA